MRIITRVGTTATASLIIIAALAGCSSVGKGTPSKSPSASSTAAASSGVADDSGKCTDGVSTPIKSDSEFSLGSCAFVDVMGSKNTITAGKLEKLTVEGDANTITVQAVDEVTTSGKGNTIYYSGSEPTLNEVGSDNTLMPLSAKKE